MAPVEAAVFPYINLDEEDLDGCQDCLALYRDLVLKDPEMAMSWADLLASGAGAVGHVKALETVLPIKQIEVDTSVVTSADAQSESYVGATSPSTDSVQATPPASNSHARRRYNYYCEVCGHSYDRAQRARDCANRDTGLTPHACRSQCGRMNWYM